VAVVPPPVPVVLISAAAVRFIGVCRGQGVAPSADAFDIKDDEVDSGDTGFANQLEGEEEEEEEAGAGDDSGVVNGDTQPV